MFWSINSAKRSPQSVATNRSCKNAISLPDLTVFIFYMKLLLLFVFQIISAAQWLRQTRHFCLGLRIVMNVAIAFTVAHVFHKRSDCVSQVQGDWFARSFRCVAGCRMVG